MANRHIKTGTCSVEAWFPGQSYTSSKQSTYISMTGCIPSRFKERERDLVQRQQDSSSLVSGKGTLSHREC